MFPRNLPGNTLRESKQRYLQPLCRRQSAKRSARHAIDMKRIRAAASGDALVERLLTAAFSAMANATENHASEWMPGGASQHQYLRVSNLSVT